MESENGLTRGPGPGRAYVWRIVVGPPDAWLTVHARDEESGEAEEYRFGGVDGPDVFVGGAR